MGGCGATPVKPSPTRGATVFEVVDVTVLMASCMTPRSLHRSGVPERPRCMCARAHKSESKRSEWGHCQLVAEQGDQESFNAFVDFEPSWSRLYMLSRIASKWQRKYAAQANRMHCFIALCRAWFRSSLRAPCTTTTTATLARTSTSAKGDMRCVALVRGNILSAPSPNNKTNKQTIQTRRHTERK